MFKKIALVFGILGFIALGVAVFYLTNTGISQVFLFCVIATLFLNVYVVTRSNIAVLGIVIAHVIGLIALYKSGSNLYLSIPYIALPFLGLLPRGVLFYEKLKHTHVIWLEPVFFLAGVAFYVVEFTTTQQLPTNAKLFPLVFFLTNGIIMITIFNDGIKMTKRLKAGFGMATGEKAPLFELPDENNKPISLSSYIGKHHVLLIFVRGEWCPMCHIMLRTYMKESTQFQEKNIFLMVIGPDPTGVNHQMAESLKLDFHVLSDHNLEVTSKYHLKIKAPHLLHAGRYTDEKEIPLPASFLVDKNGIIRYSSHANKVGEIVRLNDIFPIVQSL